MAYITVTTQADVVDPGDGKLSLREVLAAANHTASSDTIRFSAAVAGQTLVLTGGELTITNDVVIDGNNSGATHQTTVDANHASRVLNIVGEGTNVKLDGLTITNGYSNGEYGGAIRLNRKASLEIVDCSVTGNDTGGGKYGKGADGGGIFADTSAHLTLERTIVSDNHTGGFNNYGGGIAAHGQNKIVIQDSTITANTSRFGGGLAVRENSIANIQSTNFTNNQAITPYNDSGGGALSIFDSSVVVSKTTFSRNKSRGSGGSIFSILSYLTILDSTIEDNHAAYPDDDFYNHGGGIWASGNLFIQNSTVTGNSAGDADTGESRGGGIYVVLGTFDIANSIVSGNSAKGSAGQGHDVFGDSIGGSVVSNGHNVFGSSVSGNVPGDREKIAPATLFASVDPATGGGKLDPRGIVPLKKNLLSNPALSAADPITASAFGQLGTTKRPLPAGSLPDIGAVEADQPLSTSPTANNDVITGSNAANNLSGLAGNDYLKGLGGNDTLNGGDGSDMLDGGPGNDKLIGGNGVDIVTYAGTTAVVVDLSINPATAKRGSETDTLTSIEGASGSDKADSFKGDANNNEFQGGHGRDTYTGGAGRDIFDFNAVADSPAGAGRDVIRDFTPGQDVLGLAGIDADTTIPGEQTFRWVGKATLTGAAQLGYYVSGGNTIVRASTDADGKAELEIQLNGKKTLTEGDFRF